MLGEILSSVAGNLLGGIFGEDSREDTQAFARQQQAHSDALQREFAQHGIRWRVADAKEAGIHPVFALSGGGAAYSPSAVTVNAENHLGDAMQRMGQDVGRAIASQESAEQRVARQLSEAEIESRVLRNRAEASMFESQTLRNLNQVNGPGMPSLATDPIVQAYNSTTPGTGPTAANNVVVEPSKVTSYSSTDPSVSAGKDVTWKPFRVDASGKTWYLPNADSASEALESVSESWPMQALVIRENMRRNPYFLAENRGLFPFGEELGRGAEWAIQKYVDTLKRYHNWKPDFNERNRKMDWSRRHGIPASEASRMTWTGRGAAPWNR